MYDVHEWENLPVFRFGRSVNLVFVYDGYPSFVSKLKTFSGDISPPVIIMTESSDMAQAFLKSFLRDLTTLTR